MFYNLHYTIYDNHWLPISDQHCRSRSCFLIFKLSYCSLIIIEPSNCYYTQIINILPIHPHNNHYVKNKPNRSFIIIWWTISRHIWAYGHYVHILFVYCTVYVDRRHMRDFASCEGAIQKSIFATTPVRRIEIVWWDHLNLKSPLQVLIVGCLLVCRRQ